MFRQIFIIILLLACGLVTACTTSNKPDDGIATTTPVTTFGGELTPYQPASATPKKEAVRSASATPFPSPTATPRTHVVKQGEDMGGIAFQYRVPIADLLAANPKVNPRAMSIGTVLIIPTSKTPMPTTAVTSAQQPSITPIPAELGKLNCITSREGGIWCFQLMKNNREFTLEGITADFKLSDKTGKIIVSQKASLPLDRLPSGVTLPLAAYFTPEQAGKLKGPFQASSEILTALTSAENGRYVNVSLANQKVMISADGLSAAITLDASQPKGEAQAKRLWLAAIAYDAQGNVVGVRRWEKSSNQALQAGQSLSIDFNVYSISGQISRVDIVAEARP